MTDSEQGGEPPCLAHLADAPQVDDRLLGEVVRELADAVIIADAEGSIVFWIDAATRLFGWTAEQAVGQSLDLIIPERQRTRHWEGYRRVMATGHTEYGARVLAVLALHADGRRLSIAFTVTLHVPPGMTSPTAIAAVVRDNTARWQESLRLREELAALRAGSVSDT